MKRIFLFSALLSYLCLGNLEVSAQTSAPVSAQDARHGSRSSGRPGSSRSGSRSGIAQNESRKTGLS